MSPVQRPADAERTRTSWWLVADATCGFCAQAHASGTAHHCVRCDRPVCVLCAVEVEVHRTAVCPECAREEG